MYRILRATYHRVRLMPLIGPAADAVRQRFLKMRDTADDRYAEQQTLLEAHGHALDGLRQGLVRQDKLMRNECSALRDEQNLLRQCLQDATAAGEEIRRQCEAEILKQADYHNRRFDEQRVTLESRLEFQRQELLFELRYCAPARKPEELSSQTQPTSLILNAEKLSDQRRQGAIRLNVGCGHKPEPDRINVDMRELPGVDVVSTVDRLPFAAGELQEIYCAHLLEHFPLERLRRSLLPAWLRLLRPGGEMRCIVPDAAAMLDAYHNGDVDFANLRLVIFGGQEYEGDFHQTMFTPQSLAELFIEIGLDNVQIDARARQNGLCLECEVVGRKP